MLEQMTRKVPTMGETTLSVTQETAARVRLIRAELNVDFGRRFNVNDVLTVLLKVYESSENKKEIAREIVEGSLKNAVA